MDKHNTQVHLVSEVGVGTTFWFDLPVYDLAEYVEANYAAIAEPTAGVADAGREYDEQPIGSLTAKVTKNDTKTASSSAV